MERQQTYRICVRGELDAQWSSWFGGLAIEARPGDVTVLSGPLADQAALHGVLAAIRDLGLALVSVELVLPSTTTSLEGRD